MKPSNGVPDAAEFGQIRSYLANPDVNGNRVSQADIKKYLEDLPKGATRQEITKSLIQMCRQLPEPI